MTAASYTQQLAHLLQTKSNLSYRAALVRVERALYLNLLPLPLKDHIPQALSLLSSLTEEETFQLELSPNDDGTASLFAPILHHILGLSVEDAESALRKEWKSAPAGVQWDSTSRYIFITVPQNAALDLLQAVKNIIGTHIQQQFVPDDSPLDDEDLTIHLPSAPTNLLFRLPVANDTIHDISTSTLGPSVGLFGIPESDIFSAADFIAGQFVAQGSCITLVTTHPDAAIDKLRTTLPMISPTNRYDLKSLQWDLFDSSFIALDPESEPYKSAAVFRRLVQDLTTGLLRTHVVLLDHPSALPSDALDRLLTLAADNKLLVLFTQDSPHDLPASILDKCSSLIGMKQASPQGASWLSTKANGEPYSPEYFRDLEPFSGVLISNDSKLPFRYPNPDPAL